MGWKRLGAVAPAADTDTTLYTAPAGTATMITTIFCVNRGSASAAVRVAVRDGAIANEDYIAYDVVVPPYTTWPITAGVVASDCDIVNVRADTADTSFSAFGNEGV